MSAAEMSEEASKMVEMMRADGIAEGMQEMQKMGLAVALPSVRKLLKAVSLACNCLPPSSADMLIAGISPITDIVGFSAQYYQGGRMRRLDCIARAVYLEARPGAGAEYSHDEQFYDAGAQIQKACDQTGEIHRPKILKIFGDVLELTRIMYGKVVRGDYAGASGVDILGLLAGDEADRYKEIVIDRETSTLGFATGHPSLRVGVCVYFDD